jgi:hypothetical protein
LRRPGAAARSASALDDAAAKPNANGDPSTDNAIRREIIADVTLPIMSASKLTLFLETHMRAEYMQSAASWASCSAPGSVVSRQTVCRASLIMWLTDFIYMQDELF